jgi:hypothetical protein
MIILLIACAIGIIVISLICAIAMMFLVWFLCGLLRYIALKMFHKQSTYSRDNTNAKFHPHQLSVCLVNFTKCAHKIYYAVTRIGDFCAQPVPIRRYSTRNDIYQEPEKGNNANDNQPYKKSAMLHHTDTLPRAEEGHQPNANKT